MITMYIDEIESVLKLNKLIFKSLTSLEHSHFFVCPILVRRHDEFPSLHPVQLEGKEGLRDF